MITPRSSLSLIKRAKRNPSVAIPAWNSFPRIRANFWENGHGSERLFTTHGRWKDFLLSSRGRAGGEGRRAKQSRQRGRGGREEKAARNSEKCHTCRTVGCRQRNTPTSTLLFFYSPSFSLLAAPISLRPSCLSFSLWLVAVSGLIRLVRPSCRPQSPLK